MPIISLPSPPFSSLNRLCQFQCCCCCCFCRPISGHHWAPRKRLAPVVAAAAPNYQPQLFGHSHSAQCTAAASTLLVIYFFVSLFWEKTEVFTLPVQVQLFGCVCFKLPHSNCHSVLLTNANLKKCSFSFFLAEKRRRRRRRLTAATFRFFKCQFYYCCCCFFLNVFTVLRCVLALISLTVFAVGMFDSSF